MPSFTFYTAPSFYYNFLSRLFLFQGSINSGPATPLEVTTKPMELVVRKNELLRELQLFQGIVERKNTIPILANVLIEAKGDEVRLLATDLEVALRSRCQASVAKGGSLTLPAKKLYEIVKSLPETDVRIEEDKNGVKVAADRFDSRMQTLPREDFPTLPEAAGTARASLPRDALREMVAKTQFAITGEDTRYFLNGALFVLRTDSMSLVATDGHRLALVTVKRGEADQSVGAGEVKVILPKKTLLELGRLLSEGEGDIHYERGENHLFFEVAGRVLISRMIDGQFPAYERVIPKSNDKEIEFERERLTSAVRRVALLSNERSRAVKFEIDKGKVEVTSSSSEFGEARELIPVDYDGVALTISFNAQYVLDFLNVADTDVVSLSLKDEVSQAVMKPVGADGYEYTYVIMPMRI
jgi:DNA polymerase III subunit beta